MKTIWKFELKVTDHQTIKLPKEADILSVQSQNETVCLWALVNPKNELEDRYFEIFGTGHPIALETTLKEYVGTFQLHGGSLVFHLFEKI